MRNPGLAHTQQFFLFGLFCILFFFLRCTPGGKGPGGPILIISDIATNPFSTYYAEILRAEGLNEFDVAATGDISARTIDNYDVILLGDIPVSGTLSDYLTRWVEKGGMLIAFRPDSLLHSLFGIKQNGKKVLDDKYILINKGTAAGAGVTNESLQYHGGADLYSLSGAVSLATLYSDAVTATVNPAVTSHVFGKGKAIAFAYDLARSVVYTRQGNPSWQGRKNGVTTGPVRSSDLFFNNAGADSIHEYIDFDKIAIPQADEQQRFLCNIILKLNSQGKPLPRFWYLPQGLKAAVVMTGDDHNLSGTPARFDKYLKSGPNTAEDVQNWKAIRATSYIYASNRMNDKQAKTYEDQGFEIALHLSTGCTDWTPKSLDDEWVSQLGKFEEKYPELKVPATNRTHCMCWSDWASQAKVQAQHGVRLDVNYYYWPGAWVKNRPGLFTGSAIPMRFADINGTIIDCYQAPTQISDESDINFTRFTTQLLDKAIGKEGYYGVFVANMHTDEAEHPGSDIIVSSALKRNIPVISAKQLLTWLDGRSNSSFGSITWNGEELSFYILAAPGSYNMKAMLPVSFQSGKLFSIRRNSQQVPFTTETIKGIQYAFFDAETGNYNAVYREDNAAPAITNVSAEPAPDGTAIISWMTDEPADSRIDYGISGTSLTMLERDALPQLNHSIKLSGLFPGNTYHFRISSADEAGNVSVNTPFDKLPVSFTMPGPVLIDDNKFSAKQVSGVLNNIHFSEANGGEITLRPVFHQHFSGNSLPAGMNAAEQEKGSFLVSNGNIKIDGAAVWTNRLFAPGSALEFEAVFDKEKDQAIGFATTIGKDESLTVAIGTNDSLKGIYAKVGKLPEVLLLYATEFKLPHRYRIEWKATRFVFFVDNIESATISVSIKDSMHVILKDAIADTLPLNAHWLEVSPYTSTTASYTSVVYAEQQPKKWDWVNWMAETPTGTTVKVFCRTGNTPVPDKSWTVFTAVEKNKNISRITSRYIQYKVELSTDDLNISPVFKSITITGSNAE